MHKKPIMQVKLLLFVCMVFSKSSTAQQTSFKDTTFLQEYHKAYPTGNDVKEKEVRSIAVDNEGNVWIATAAGVMVKNKKETSWSSPFAAIDKGPAFAVVTDKEGTV